MKSAPVFVIICPTRKSLHMKRQAFIIKVVLLAHTPEPEKIIAASAKLCYSASGIENIMDGLTDAETARFTAMLESMGHESPVEHAVFTFGIEGVSRSFLAQITRHRIASYSVKSQRYVSESDFEYVIPPEIEEIPEAKAEFTAAMEEDARHYKKLRALLLEHRREKFTAEGKSEKAALSSAEKAANEDARFVLPNACETKLICTFDARSLMHFFSLRCCMRAQWEIRAVADEMLRLVKEAAPDIFKTAGPPCLRGACPEGKMSCGKADEVRKRFLGYGAQT